MRNLKKALSLTLALALSLALTVPALAAEDKWDLTVAGKPDSETFTGERTFTLRYWNWTEDEEARTRTVTKAADTKNFKVENLCVAGKGDTLVFTNGGEMILSVSMMAWSDPDGDGVYDNRMMKANYEQIDKNGLTYYTQVSRPVPADAAGPLIGVTPGWDGDLYYNEFVVRQMQEYDEKSGEYVYLEDVEICTGDGIIEIGPSELRIPVDQMLETFGPNTLLYLFDYDWETDITLSWGVLLSENTQPTTPTEPEKPADPVITVDKIPAKGTAVASTQSVELDGKKVEFQMYALKDEKGSTNYIKLRDLGHILNGTKAQFNVGYSKETGITVTTGQAYQGNGSEMNTPFSGDRAYAGGGRSVQINGKAVELTAFVLTDDAGGGYTYFKLRDLGAALGFNVSWSADRGVYVETGKPYVG